MSVLRHKRVLLGVTGGIAAYKSADLVRALTQSEAAVRVVMTAAAHEFITPVTMQAVSGHKVYSSLFDDETHGGMGHIELARWADLILVAPATADFMAQLAHGHAAELLTTLCLAATSPIALAPAMNQAMWENQATQDNCEQLKKRGITILGPAVGAQACGEWGFGRMLEPLDIIASAEGLFASGALSGVTIVITAGPTHETIDPVRYLSNHSSGKMGYALAQAASAMGGRVVLISGPVALAPPPGVAVISVVSAHEMAQAVADHIDSADIFISAAAVADFRVAEPKSEKIPKEVAGLTLHLIKNEDILVWVASHKPRPFCVGFAAETHDLIAKAKEKLTKKSLDMIIANQVGMQDQGFHSDYNACQALWAGGEKAFARMEKRQLARELVLLIAEHYRAKKI
jgi:phosphopantothenoylcysteine decarboxylase/phosphopantothenate--cysteine ligase